MKRHLATAILIAIFLPVLAPAQEYVNTPVEISKEKVKIEGKVCYSHIVLEKQTLYSISKAYGVSIDDIYRFNPSVKESGLKKNSIIIIPSAEALASVTPKVKEQKSPTQEDNSKVKGETRAKEEVPEETPKDTGVPTRERAQRIHIVKWIENLDIIAEKYGVSVEAIMKANNLKGLKLEKRQKLIIPFPDENYQKPEDTLKKLAEVPVSKRDTLATDITVAVQDSEIDATIILPLTTTEGEPNKNNMDFYCGALLAVYDLGNQGINCKLNVYDIMDTNSQMGLETLKKSDVIIGPISTADLTRVFAFAPNISAVVSPLDQRAEKLTLQHTNMFQIPTPLKCQYQDLTKWIEEEYQPNDRVLMISEKGSRQNGIAGQMKEALDSSYFAYSPFAYSILEGRDVTAPLTELMTTEGTNRVIIASESEAFVNDVVRNLNLLKLNNLDIVLYAPSKIRSFDTIEVENFHNTSMRVSLNYYIDYEDEAVKDFLLKYRALYNTEPSQFAFQGYDITKFFLSTCSEYGDSWKEHVCNHREKMLQSIYNIEKEPFKGYVNKGVRRIIYDNGYSIITIR